jgi:hypothetical protein
VNVLQLLSLVRQDVHLFPVVNQTEENPQTRQSLSSLKHDHSREEDRRDAGGRYLGVSVNVLQLLLLVRQDVHRRVHLLAQLGQLLVPHLDLDKRPHAKSLETKAVDLRIV